MRPGVRDAESQGRTYLLWGVGGVVVMVLVLLAAVAVYAVPIGEKTYHAEIGSSGGVRAGDDIRIAGIPVGEVRSVALSGDHVDMKFTVRNAVFVGDASTLSVQLLTPIGGHFVALMPSGDVDLGDTSIPKEHTETPFELSDTLEKATPVLRDLDGTTLRQTVDQIDRALVGQPTAMREIADNMTGLTAAIADRQDDLDRTLAVADEYIGRFASDNAVLLDLLAEIAKVTAKLGAKRAEVIHAFNLLGRLFYQLYRPVVALDQGLGPSIDQLEELGSKLQGQVGTLDTALTTARDFSAKITTLLQGGRGAEIDQSTSTIAGITLCVPLPGKVC